MDQRKKIILIAAAALIVLGILALFFRPKRAEDPSASSSVESLTSSSTGVLTRSGGITEAVASPASEPLPAPPAETAVRQIVMTFAERYGSFSSEGDYMNITDLFPLMTERYRRRSEAEIARLRAKAPATGFQAITSVVITAAVELPNGEASEAATARATTQRTEVRSGVPTRTYEQILIVQLVKVGEGWRVDEAKWGPESQ